MKTISKLTFTTLAALAVALVFQAPVTRADEDGRDNRIATVSWTKWVTAFYPNGPTSIFGTIAGIAGGDLGAATLVGEFTGVFRSDGITADIEGDYHFTGSKHSCTVHFHAVQTIHSPTRSTGVIRGIVTDGWLKGNAVTGGFVGYPSTKGVFGSAFDGVFEIERGTKAKN